MNILHLSKFYPPVPGGIENFVRDLAVAQVKQGHAVYVLAHQTEFAKPTIVESMNGVTVIRIRTFGQLAYTPITPEFISRLRFVANHFKPDVIHAHLPNISAFWLLFSSIPCPIVLHWHADVVASKIDRKMAFFYNFYKPWETWLLQKADRIICTSDTYLRHSAPLRRWREKCRVIPLGIDPERMNPCDHLKKNSQKTDPRSGTGTPPPLSSTDPGDGQPPFLMNGAKKNPAVSEPINDSNQNNTALTVLSVGRFSYYKGFEYLVEAAEKISDTRFIIVGDGPEYAAIKNQVDKKKLKNRVFLPGKVSRKELIRLFNLCDIFCLPSLERTEAFGLVLIEAMYFGKSLITSRIPGSGITEVNEHGITGLQIPATEAGAIVEAVNDLKTNINKRISMGRAGQRRFNRDFHIDPVSVQIEKLYADIPS